MTVAPSLGSCSSQLRHASVFSKETFASRNVVRFPEIAPFSLLVSKTTTLKFDEEDQIKKCFRRSEGSGGTPSPAGEMPALPSLLLEQAENTLRQQVRLREHRCSRLDENVLLRVFSRFLSHVHVFNPRTCRDQVFAVDGQLFGRVG
jgi:hypothetical protein